jgi:hypothetical protein
MVPDWRKLKRKIGALEAEIKKLRKENSCSFCFGLGFGPSGTRCVDCNPAEVPVTARLMFSDAVASDILSGKKTQERRVMAPQPHVGRYGATHPTRPSGVIGPIVGCLGGGDYHVWRGPLYNACLTETGVYVALDQCPYGEIGDQLSIGVERTKLEITRIRIERLNQISEEDACAEGVIPLQMDGGSFLPRFEGLWDATNGKHYPWAANPWVWCISFRRAK